MRFLGKHVVPLLEETTEANEWYVAHRWEGEDGSYSLEIFVWAPGTEVSTGLGTLAARRRSQFISTALEPQSFLRLDNPT